jgi:hypothetical protein
MTMISSRPGRRSDCQLQGAARVICQHAADSTPPKDKTYDTASVTTEPDRSTSRLVVTSNPTEGASVCLTLRRKKLEQKAASGIPV